MGSGFSKLKKQAKQMEQQYAEMQSKLETERHIGQSSGGLVSITLDGKKKVVSLKIQPECVDSEDVEGLEDLITEAFNVAHAQCEKEQSNNQMEGMPFPMG